MADHHYDYHHQKHDQNGQKQTQVVVVMVPCPAQSHLNQLLQLSRLISSYDILVHYVGTATHIRQAKLCVHGWNPLATANIHFHELPTPAFLSPSPNPNASIHFPSHLHPLLDASSHLRRPIATLLRALSSTARRIIIINDSVMASVVQDVACIPNAESYTFNSVSAFFIFFYCWEAMGKPFPVEAELLKDLPSLEGCFTPEFMEFIVTQNDYEKFSSGHLYNSCKAIEGPFIDLLAREDITFTPQSINQWAIGPFIPAVEAESDEKKQQPSQRHRCLEWLDKQGPNSVIYVSFGTTTSLSDEQIKELAIGLERSDQKFIWVLRDADKGDVFVGETRRPQLPEGFEERVEKNGMVVRDWALNWKFLDTNQQEGS